MAPQPRVSNVETPPPFHTESPFDLAEAERQAEFIRSVNQQEKEYTDEDSFQWEGELSRAEEFDKLVIEVRSAFDVNEERQNRSFLDACEERDVIFQKNDKIRENVFSESQISFAAAFEKSLAARTAQAEWHRSIRADHFRLGRQAREKACNKLENALKEQIETLLRTQEEAFVCGEHRRDEIDPTFDEDEELISSLWQVYDNPHQEVESTTSWTPLIGMQSDYTSAGRSPSSVYSNEHPPDLFALPPAPSEFPTGFPMNSYPNIMPTQLSPTLTNGPAAPDVWKMSYTDATDVWITAPDWALSPIGPRTCTPVIEHVPTVMPDSTLCATQADTTSKGSLSFPDAIVHEIGAIHDSLGTDRGHNVAESTPSFDNVETRFRYAQKERQSAFESKEEYRENRFQKAEAARDGKEAERSLIFARPAKDRQDKFQMMLSMHEERFHGAKLGWDRRETYRDQRHQVAQHRRSQEFDQQLSAIHVQFWAENEHEETSFTLAQKIIMQLDREQRQVLQERRQQRGTYSMQQQPYPDALRLYPSREHINAIVRGRKSWNTGKLSRSFEAKKQSNKRNDSPSARAPSLTSHMRVLISVFTRWRSQTESIGFAPHALFVSPGLRDPLPVPSTSKVPTAAEVARDYQLLFGQAQADRNEAFRNGVQRRRHIFEINETRRFLEFNAKQKERRNALVEKGDEQEVIFREAQNTRWRQFMTWEAEREQTFCAAQKARNSALLGEEGRREELFQAKQRELQQLCIEAESRRLSDLEILGAKLLEQREIEARVLDWEEQKQWRAHHDMHGGVTGVQNRQDECIILTSMSQQREADIEGVAGAAWDHLVVERC